MNKLNLIKAYKNNRYLDKPSSQQGQLVPVAKKEL